MDSRNKKITWAFTVWALLQLPRLVALPLIVSAVAGKDSPAWLFPAIVDIVVAVGVPIAILCVWRLRNIFGWLFCLAWLVVSIFDHANAVTAFLISGVPSIFADMGSTGVVVPFIQAIVDVGFIAALSSAKYRKGFVGA